MTGLMTLAIDPVDGLRLCHPLTGQRKCHPMRELTLNQQEQTRIQVLNSVLEYQLPIAQAAEIMGLSQRHTKRLLAAYRRDGPVALAHGNRGRRPHNAVPEAAAAAAVRLASSYYAGAKPHSPYRTAAGAGGHRPEPSHGASHLGKGWHGQPAQSSLSAAPFPAASHAPRGHAGASRR